MRDSEMSESSDVLFLSLRVRQLKMAEADLGSHHGMRPEPRPRMILFRARVASWMAPEVMGNISTQEFAMSARSPVRDPTRTSTARR